MSIAPLPVSVAPHALPAPSAHPRPATPAGAPAYDGGLSPQTRALFVEYRATRAPRILARLVEQYTGLAVHLARRFRASAEEDEDLRQVAFVGLVAAVVRFDPEMGSSFPSFAVPTITGELKRHLRDRTWDLKVPRSAKEASLRVARATEELELTLGRRPTAEELRDETGLDQAQVADARAASQAHSIGSIDVGEGLDHPAVAAEDPRFEVLIDLTSSRPVIQGLPPRERELLHLRYCEDLTQTQIAERLGMSQVQVSRILSAAICHIRREVTRPPRPVRS